MKTLIYTAALAQKFTSRARPLLIVTIGLLIALLSAALTYSTPPAMDGTFGTGVVFVQATTAQQKDLSEIGSTDGIVVMGFVIALIVVAPILWHRKSWMATR